MKKLMLTILALLMTFSAFGAVETTLWEKCAVESTLPGWFDTGHLTRGFAYGQIDGEDRLVVVSRNGGNNLFVLDAANGDSLSRLDPYGITGGTYHISDAAISEDGDVYVCNLALNTTLKVYKYESADDTAEVAISHLTTGRLGDKMSVYGSKVDNSLTLLFADSNNPQVVRFTTADNGATFVADTIAVDNNGGSASAALNDGTAMYHNSSGNYLKRYDGASSSVISGGTLGTGTNATEYIFTDSDNNEYVAAYQYGTGNENARILKVPNGDLAEASTYYVTSTLGLNGNANGAGDVAVKDNGDGTYTVFVLSCNNGLGAYKFEFPVPPVDPVNMTQVWDVWGDEYSFFLSSGDAARGMGYNPVNEHVYIASRAGGAYVHVFEDGVAIDTLDMTGVTGGFYGISLMKADAADDGKIYACNLASGGDFKVYQWADEASAPTVAVQLAVTSRFGDVLEVSGSGVDTKIYASARGGTEIKVFGTSDGLTFIEEQSIPIAAAAADGGISVVDESMLWVNAAWKDMTLIDTAGTVLATMDLPESYYGSVQYMEAANGAKLLATNTNHSAGNRRKVEVYDITDAANPSLWASAEMGNIEKGNGNVAGNLKYDLNDDGTIALYQMATNNAIVAWTLEVPEVIEITDIADVKADLDGDYVPDMLDSAVTVRGIVYTPSYVGGTSVYIMDETGGTNIFNYSAVTGVAKGDLIQVSGTVDHYRGLTEVAFSAVEDVTVLSSENPIMPTVVTLAEIGEAIEGNYVKVEKVKLVDASQWPDEGSSANVDVTDGVDTVTFRIDSDTDLDGQAAPTWEFDLVGAVSQFTYSDPADDGYQILATFYDELVMYSPVLDELDENFESWTELSNAWEFENIRLANDAYALEGTGKYLGLANLDSAGMVKTPYIKDPKQLRYYMSEHTGGSDVWNMTVLLVDESDMVVDTLDEWGAPGDFNWHLSVVDIDMVGNYAIMFVGAPVVSGSFYLDQISVKPAPAVAEISPASVDFDVVDVNTSAYATVYLKNVAPVGAEDLMVDSLGLGNDKFTAMIDTNIVPAGDSTAITIMYTPTNESEDNDIMSVWYGDDMHGMVGLSGSGNIVWPLQWRVHANADWMGQSANAPRTMAYSAKTGNLYFVAHPNGYGDFIKAVSTDSGTVVKDLNMLSPLPSAGYLKINAVAATDDGQIFTCNLSSGSTFNLFRNANEDADMNLAYSGAGIPIRVGDALAASGEGVNTKVYVSGTGAGYIYVLNTSDGENYALADSVAITAGAASRAIAPVQNGAYFFINGTGSAPMYVKADGTVLYTFDTGVVPSGTAINYFEVEVAAGMRRFVGITNAWSSGTKVVELLGTPGDGLCSSVEVINAPTDTYNEHANGNATGMAIYDVYKHSVVELITNNGVSSYSLAEIESSPIIPEKDTTAIADGMPTEFQLHQNYPNPFNPTTTIRFDLPEDLKVNLAIYDISGRKIRTLINENVTAGYNQVVWNGMDRNGNPVSTGMYIYKLQAGDMIDVKKMTFLK